MAKPGHPEGWTPNGSEVMARYGPPLPGPLPLGRRGRRDSERFEGHKLQVWDADGTRPDHGLTRSLLGYSGQGRGSEASSWERLAFSLGRARWSGRPSL